MVEIAKFLEIFKLKLSIFVALTLALGAFLFLPDGAAKQFGIQEIRTKYKSYAGCAFIITASLVTVQSLAKAGGYIRKRSLRSKFRKKAIQSLHNLTPTEKQILCGYILPNERTQYLSIQDGIVNGLCAAGIIYRSANVGNLYGRGYAFNIEDWAWDYLQAHPELITEGVPTDSQGRVILYANPDYLIR